MKIAVIGAGSWGTALASILATTGKEVVLWGRNPEFMAQLANDRENRRYLPDHSFPKNLKVSSDGRDASEDSELIIFAAPVMAIRNLANSIAPHAKSAKVVVSASKGWEEKTLLSSDAVLADVFQSTSAVLLSGPTFAQEIAANKPAAAVAASKSSSAADKIQKLFYPTCLRVYTSTDVIGVAVGGALKNVIAIAAGCSDGLGFGRNARAALITRGVHEMSKVVAKLGGDPLTLSGLAGMGDLVLTCTGDLSRNRQVGLALARGESADSLKARSGQVAEGLGAALVAVGMADELGIDMPITRAVADVLKKRKSAKEAVDGLLSRETGQERG